MIKFTQCDSKINTKATMTTSIIIAVKVMIVPTAATDTGASKRWWLHKILEVEIFTSWYLKITHLQLKAQILGYVHLKNWKWVHELLKAHMIQLHFQSQYPYLLLVGKITLYSSIVNCHNMKLLDNMGP